MRVRVRVSECVSECECAFINLDIVPLNVVTPSSLHTTDGGCLSPNYIYGASNLPVIDR